MKTSLPASVITARLATAPSRYSCLWAALGCAALAFAAQRAGAAVTEAWVQRYNSPANLDATPSAVAVDISGAVAVTGTSFNGTNWDYYTAKYAAGNGALIWERTYSGLGNDNDYGKAVAVDSSGSVVVTGWSYDTSYVEEYYTAKYAAADGALLWEKHYNNSGRGAAASALALDSSGNVVVTGTTFEGYYTAKYAAPDGALLWEQRYNTSADRAAYARSVALDKSGNVVVTGWSRLWAGGPSYCYTAKYAAADGVLLWENVSDAISGRKVAVDGSGNVVVIGTFYGDPQLDYYTAKYAAADGALLWEQYYNAPENGSDEPNGVAVDASGNVVVTGSDSSIGTYTVKYAAADGALLWEKHDNSLSPYVGAAALALDSLGNVVVTGITFNGTNGDYYTAKYGAADGALLWEKLYNGPDDGDDRVSSLALGPNGMVAITGSSVGAFGNQGFATVVYWENLTPLGIAMVTSGVRLRFTGVPGSSYTIERAPAATGPWDTLATPTAPLDGLVDYIDANPPTVTAFYRTRAP